MIYEVLFNRDTSQEITIKVEADSREAAEEMATEELGDGFDHDWSESDYLGDIVLVYVSEAED